MKHARYRRERCSYIASHRTERPRDKREQWHGEGKQSKFLNGEQGKRQSKNRPLGITKPKRAPNNTLGSFSHSYPRNSTDEHHPVSDATPHARLENTQDPKRCKEDVTEARPPPEHQTVSIKQCRSGKVPSSGFPRSASLPKPHVPPTRGKNHTRTFATNHCPTTAP